MKFKTFKDLAKHWYGETFGKIRKEIVNRAEVKCGLSKQELKRDMVGNRHVGFNYKNPIV